MSKLAVTVNPSPNHICPQSDGNKPHATSIIIPNDSNVFFEKKQACRHGDKLQCVSPKLNSAVASTSGIFINGKPAIRGGDSSEHGGKIIPNTTTIFIG